MRYCFGDYTLDSTWLRLTRCGQVLPISRRGFTCLCYLIDQRDHVIGRDELIRKVWGRDNVSDNQLAKVVLAVRHAVGDNGSAQRLIRTVQGVGYHWAAAVQEDAGAAEQAFMPVTHAATEALCTAISLPVVAISVPAVTTCKAASIQSPRFQKSALASFESSPATLTEEILLWRMTPDSPAADIRIAPWWFALALSALLAVVAGIGAQVPSFTAVVAASLAPASPAPLARKNPALTLAQIARGRGLVAAANAQDLQTGADAVIVRR